MKIDFEVLFLEVVGLEGCLEVCNFVGIYVMMVDMIVVDVLCDFVGKGFGVFKLVLGELLVEKLVLINVCFVVLKEDCVVFDVIL